MSTQLNSGCPTRKKARAHRSLVRNGAREQFFSEGQGVKVKNQVVSCNILYVDFHPTPWNRADC